MFPRILVKSPTFPGFLFKLFRTSGHLVVKRNTDRHIQGCPTKFRCFLLMLKFTFHTNLTGAFPTRRLKVSEKPQSLRVHIIIPRQCLKKIVTTYSSFVALHVFRWFARLTGNAKNARGFFQPIHTCTMTVISAFASELSMGTVDLPAGSVMGPKSLFSVCNMGLRCQICEKYVCCTLMQRFY